MDASELPWTGERLVPSFHGDTAIEHLHRYAFACEYAEGKDVLDIACGEGYGSRLLAEVAASVVGVDIAEDAIAHALKRYGQPDRISFQVGRCTAIPLDDSSVDMVVSFETLEHVDEHDAMLREIRRVLRPGGTLIISTPDKLHYTLLPGYSNPYHVRELFTKEFELLLSRFFSKVCLFEQRICHGSVLVPATGLPIASFRHYHGDFRRLMYTEGIVAPLYNLAVASDATLKAPHHLSLFQGIGIPTEVEKQLGEANRAAAEARGLLQQREEQLRRQTEHYQTTIVNMRRENEAAVHQACADAVREQQRQLAELRAELDEITRSRAWRVARSLRRFKSLLRAPFRLGIGRRAAA